MRSILARIVRWWRLTTHDPSGIAELYANELERNLFAKAEGERAETRKRLVTDWINNVIARCAEDDGIDFPRN